MSELKIETLKKISMLCRYLHCNCCEFTYAEKRGFVIPESVQEEKLQAIKNCGSEITKLIDEL